MTTVNGGLIPVKFQIVPDGKVSFQVLLGQINGELGDE
jgi:hypothetical protein